MTTPDALREVVARIVEPEAWAVVDQHASYVARHTIPLEPRRITSLTKADAIIALTTTPLAGEVDRDCPVCHADCAGANPPMAYCPLRDDPAPNPSNMGDAEAREALAAITQAGPERDIKWAGMTARDIALFALRGEAK